MVTPVMLRQLPGLATLGLLAALLAHEAVFGGSHVAGGAYHVALILTALAGSGSLVLLGAAFAAAGGRRLAEGSVLAADLRAIVPPVPGLLGSATFWFAAIERCEPQHHGVAVAPLLCALVLATLVVAVVARWAIEQVARAVLEFTQPAHRRRLRFVQYWFAPPPSARAVAFAYRRFARPPPRS